jgi:hypothetical protein
MKQNIKFLCHSKCISLSVSYAQRLEDVETEPRFFGHPARNVITILTEILRLKF